ncbi:GNAT family N-acetyltransferase [Actinomadura algeriensis]|uniref:RimJ/RimL family protein N-acetyltransferase n=1 Tax=Actinomadura algeriensis TaxID=1679523 RepID=A0ABR9K426_9ACTN|nr:GNAT family N-acetyltransferase [Actinomadura algeriensis]MBE1537587.1 RimJ/RimL family protein N-acetyltransferase [Actinomadura algeriensis]
MYGPIAETIRTQRLVLEPPAPHDADEMAAVLDDRRLHRHLGGAPLTRDELRERYARLAAGPSPFHQEYWLYWIVRRARDGRAVGYVRATVRPAPGRYAVAPPDAGSTVTPAAPATVASVAWVIGMPYQGFGFATEAARALLGWLRDQGVREIVALIHPQNRPSAAVAAKLGLRRTAETADDETVWRLPGPGVPGPGTPG